MPHPIDHVRAFYDKLAAGDVPGLTDLLSSELEWTETESFPYYSGTWRSPSEVLEKLLVPLSRDWSEFSAAPAQFIAQDERVATIGAYHGVHRATGKIARAAFAHFWQVHDGRIVRFDMVADTLPIVRAMS